MSYRRTADNAGMTVSPEVGTESDGARSTQEKLLPQFCEGENIKK